MKKSFDTIFIAIVAIVSVLLISSNYAFAQEYVQYEKHVEQEQQEQYKEYTHDKQDEQNKQTEQQQEQQCVVDNQQNEQYDDRCMQQAAYKAPYFNSAALGIATGINSYHHAFAFNIADVMIKFRELPILFGFDIGVSSDGLSFALRADWLMFSSYFGRAGLADVYFYLTPGGDFSFALYDVLDIGLSARAPMGVSWLIDRQFEIFTELVFTLHIVSFGVGSPGYFKLFGACVAGADTYQWHDTLTTGINIGFRYWFE